MCPWGTEREKEPSCKTLVSSLERDHNHESASSSWLLPLPANSTVPLMHHYSPGRRSVPEQQTLEMRRHLVTLVLALGLVGAANWSELTVRIFERDFPIRAVW